MAVLWKEIRHAVRLLARSPGLTLVAVLSLALGIGANSAMFSIVNAVFGRHLPVPEVNRLVAVYTGDRDSRYERSCYPDYLDFRDQSGVFSGLVAHSAVLLAYSENQRSSMILGEIVSGNYFGVFGVPAARGRTLLAEDDRIPGASPVAMVSHDFWQRRFAADPGLIGRTITLNGHPFTVVGVAPQQWKGTIAGLAVEVWVPMMMHDQIFTGRSGELTRRSSHWLAITGRLQPGVDLPQARSAMETVAHRLAQQYPDTNGRRGVTLLPASQIAIDPQLDGALLGAAGLLMAVVGLVLCMAAANVASLLLARATARRREFAIRLAIGAGRWQLTRQLLAESLLLAFLGSAAGLLLAYWTIRLLITFQPPMPVAISLDVSLNGRVLLFTLVIAVLTGVLCGLVPVLRIRRSSMVSDLKDRGDAAALVRDRFGLRKILVVLQVAVSLLLLIVAGLFLRSLGKAESADPGFRTRHALIASLQPGLSGYSEARARTFYSRLVEQARDLPRVRAVALADWLPLALGVQTRTVFIEGRPVEPQGKGIEIDSAVVDLGYFRTLGIAIRRGRQFDAGDRAASPRVAVINQTMASRFWPGEDPIGKRFSIAQAGASFVQVIGVAQDGKYRTLEEEPRSYFYLPMSQVYAPAVNLVLDVAGDSRATAAAVRETVHTLAPDLPIFELKTMADHLAASLLPARLAAVLLGSFGLVGMLLASVGLYGLVSFSVARRTREMGIRMALGARRGDVLRLAIRDSMTMVAVGLAIGLVAALGSTRALAGLLYGVGTADPLTFGAVPLLLIAVALFASYIPARRATLIEPRVAASVD